MSDFENKKKKLGIPGMHYDEQKGLYDDFVSVGGKVVRGKGDPKNKLNSKLEDWIQRKEEDQLKEQAAEERRVQEEALRKKAIEEKEKLKKLSAQQQTQHRKEPPKEKEDFTTQLARKISKKKEPSPMQDYFSRLAAKIVCILYGIFTFFGRKFTRSYIDYNYLDLQHVLMDNKKILTSVLYQEKTVSSEIRARLAQTGFPYYYELLFRYDGLYEDEFFSVIKILYSEKDPTLKAKPHFIRLFKKILLLNRYQTSLFNAFEKSLFYEKNIRKLDETTVSTNLKRLNKNYNFLFFNYYPRLTNLIDYYYKDELSTGKKIAFRDFLGVTEMDAIGYLTKIWQEEEEKEKKRLEEEERKRREDAERMAIAAEEQGEGAPISDEEIKELLTRLAEPVQKGIVMLRQTVNFKDVLRYYFDKKDSRMIFPMNDKVFLAYSLMEFFDKEFSFLFVSASVQYNVFSDQGVRRDTKSALKDLYFKIDDVIYKRLNEYMKILVEIKKVNTNTYLLAKEQYARLQQLSLQRSQISRNIRVQCGQLIESFVQQLQIILEDYGHEKRILQNPEETVTFDVRILGQRMSQNQKIINVFNNAYLFSSALRYLIINGELGGSTPTLNHPVFLKIEITEVGPEEGIEQKFDV